MDPDSQADEAGRTPLMHEAFHGLSVPAISIILDAGSDVNGARADPSTPTPLHAATRGGLVGAVEALLT